MGSKNSSPNSSIIDDKHAVQEGVNNRDKLTISPPSASPPAKVGQEVPPASLSWGEPPSMIPEDERDGNDLVIQSWAYCKAKPTKIKHYRSDLEEKNRREALKWRKRSSFLELDCGEDSFFVSNTYKVVGIADGVGGWRDVGVDPSVFANNLMANAKLYSETHRTELDPKVIIKNAYEKVLSSNTVDAGSSTVCVATLQTEPAVTDQPSPSVAEGGRESVRLASTVSSPPSKTYLDVANIGDSGLLVVRDRAVYKRVHEIVHSFNAPFQLSKLPKRLANSGLFSDSVDDAVRERIEVQKGDVIVLGTDGLFDNLFNKQIAEEAGWIGAMSAPALSKVPIFGNILSIAFARYDKEIDYIDPYRVASRIVNNAFNASIQTNSNTPWSSLLRQAGIENAAGGKVDDITVLLGRISTRNEANLAAMW